MGDGTFFIQTIRGRIGQDAADAARSQLDRWVEQLAPGADGWLGSTAGVSPDGTFFAVARFSSAEQARANSDRPEQGEWWAETSKLFEGEVTFHDCPDAEVAFGEPNDAAGFVQVIEGTATDVAEVRRLDEQWKRMSKEATGRPDIIGGVAGYDGDHVVTVIYFTSEAEARKGEKEAPPPEVAELMEKQQTLMPDMTFTDLTDPWLYSRR
jgi:hypothetical protein